MRCLLLFRDAFGRLPTAQELLRCGFCVSTAALPEQGTAACGTGLARAAEPPALYGTQHGAANTALMESRPASIAPRGEEAREGEGA